MSPTPTPWTRSAPLIVIPSLNEREHIASVVQAALDDALAPQALIVVVDGGSTDGTQDIVKGLCDAHPQIRLVHNPARIQSAAVNLAVRTFGAEREWLVRMDAHAEYPRNFASSLIDAALTKHAQAVVVPMRSEADPALGAPCFQVAAAAAQNSRLGTGGAAHRMGGASCWIDHGHHALIRIETYQDVGGYDETLATNEDVDFDIRLGQLGGRVWLSVENEIVYFPRKTVRSLWKQYFRFGKGRATTFRKHGHHPKPRQWIMILLAPAVFYSALAPLYPIFLLPVAVWSAACLAYGVSLGLAASHLCAAGSGVAAMAMHLSWSLGFWTAQLQFRLQRSTGAD